MAAHCGIVLNYYLRLIYTENNNNFYIMIFKENPEARAMFWFGKSALWQFNEGFATVCEKNSEMEGKQFLY